MLSHCELFVCYSLLYTIVFKHSVYAGTNITTYSAISNLAWTITDKECLVKLA